MSKNKNSKRNGKWTQEEDDYLLYGYKNMGMTYSLLARGLNRSHASVTNRLRTLRRKGLLRGSERKPAAVKVAEKVLKSKKNEVKNVSIDVATLKRLAINAVDKFALYAEMLEKQNVELQLLLKELGVEY